MAPTAIGSKARWGRRRRTGMGCSWAAASGVQRAGHMMMMIIIIIKELI